MAIATDTDNALLGIEDAQAYLGNSTATTSDNDTVRDLINVVSWRFNAETGRNLKSRSYTSQYDGNGTSKLYLANWPVSSTTITITINANRDFTDTGDQVTSTDVMLDTGAGEVRLDSDSFTQGTHNVQVEYSAGYSTSDAFDLTYAAKEYLKILWNQETAKDPIAVRTEAYEGISRTFEPEFPWSVYRILNMYRDGRAY